MKDFIKMMGRMVPFYRGVAKFLLGKHIEAIAYFDAAIKSNPKNADAYYIRGVIKQDFANVKLAQGNKTKAKKLEKESIADETKFLKLSKKNP